MSIRHYADQEPARSESQGNIRRFVAESSRAALRQVRETLGGDAIILANRSIEGGVEVLAAAPETVDALTRRMTATTPSSLPLAPATPTELGLKPAAEPQAVGKKRLASLFHRRVDKLPEAPLAAIATPSSRAATSYLSFADELTAAATDDEDFVAQLAPEAIRRSRPTAAEQASAAPLATTAAPAPAIPTAPAIVDEPAIAAQPPFSAAELSEVVAREVSKEVSREFGRDVINDLTHDVSREVTLAVSGEVSREVSSTVTREVSSAVSREVTREVTREMRAIQAELTEQLATLTWTDSMRRQPARTRLMQDLIVAGFSPALSRHMQERMPEGHSIEQGRAWAEHILARNLPVANDAEELIAEGGVFALVGPTGVGKTTTVAKLAARFALKHGVDQLALITTDGFRIGAQDQLRIYGKILGIPVHSIHDQASLSSTIEQLANKKLVLIDTAGLSQRDDRVTEQIAMLRGAKAKRLVVLNATVDAETLDHVVATFADRDFAGCVITKTDEAARLGPVLDAVIRHRLRVHHVSTGQKVPEDLERPDAVALIKKAMDRVVTARPAFDVKSDEAPVWMSAMAPRAATLPPSLIDTTNNSGAVHA